MVVYWYFVVLLNILVNLLLLLGTNRLAGFAPGWRRVIPAGLLGGIYGGLCLIPSLRFLGNPLWRLVFLGMMASVAFGWNRFAWKRTGVFILLTLALEGILTRMGKGNMVGIFVAAILIWLLCRIGFGGQIGGREFVPLEINTGNVLLRLTALRDSGNLLRDPVTGEQVLVVDGAAGERLTGLQAGQFAKPLEVVGKMPGFRLIPYRTVGHPGGLLLARRFENVRMGDWKGSALVAFAPDSIGAGEGYRALVGGAMG